MKKLTGLIVTLSTFANVAVLSSAFADGEVKAPASSSAPAQLSESQAAEFRKEISPEGYTEGAAQVKNATDGLLQYANIAQENGAQIKYLQIIKDMDSAASYYSNLHSTCVKAQDAAATVCRERTSPKLQETLNSINTVASMISGVAVNDACSTMAKAMRIGQEGLTAYTAICSSARAACESSCSTVASNLDRIRKIVKAHAGDKLRDCTPSPSNLQACQPFQAAIDGFWSVIDENTEKDSQPDDPVKKSIVMKDKACTYTYANMIISAGAGIASVMNSLKQSAKCDDESNGTSAATTAAATPEKCAVEANKNTPECLCLANPRLPGCDNSLQKAGESSTSSLTPQSSPGLTSTGGSLSAADLSSGTNRDPAAAKANDSSSGSGMAGAPGGGGGSGLGGGGGVGGGKPADSASGDKKGLSANILGGVGGGGGGGSWGAGGSSGSGNSKYRSYLPGGDKDPNKMAGQQNWTKEVTGQGGKSNWEKVRDRYRDNNGTLLNN